MSPMKEYHIYHTKSHVHLRVYSSAISSHTNTPCQYHIHNSIFTPGKPSITISEGSSKGTVVAIARFPTWCSDFIVGIGNPEGEIGIGEIEKEKRNEAIWEEIKNKSKGICHNRYEWSMSLPSPSHTLGRKIQGSQPKKFLWIRTHHPISLAQNSAQSRLLSYSRLQQINFKLLDPAGGNIIAAFTVPTTASEGGLRGRYQKMGILRIDHQERGQNGEEWELMVLTTAMGIIEKARRRERWRRVGTCGLWPVLCDF